MKTSIFKNIVLALTSSAVLACGAAPKPNALVASTPMRECAGGKAQSDRDLASFAGCTSIQGDLEVRGVASLQPLERLARVHGKLSIENTTELESLDGLEALRNVGALELDDNRTLYDIEALSHLETATRLRIANNPELETLDGLDGLHAVAELELTHNGLIRTSGLDSVTDIGRMWVTQNLELIDMSSFNTVTRTNEVVIRDNPRLSSYFGLLQGVIQGPAVLAIQKTCGVTESAIERLRMAHSEQVALGNR